MYTLDINLLHKNYNIYIERGLINSIGSEISKIYKGRKIVIITDENVDKYYGEKVSSILEDSNFEVYKIVLNAGEKSKSIEVLMQVYEKLLKYGITRSDMMITFGGGVIGDLGGFAASTLLRGIPFIQIPTSLLAQIDSSIGGKVAVDLPQGKNLVGSFYHPEAVFVDPDLLNTLDKRFLYDGMGEVIKYGCIRDKKLFDKLLKFKNEEELLHNIEEIIYCCCNIKKAVVENDEKDTGERMILNFGHTIGHAIETYYSFEKYTHGEAVAVGMYTITKNSEREGLTGIGITKELKEILVKYNIPNEMPSVNKKAIEDIISLDKKSKGDTLNIILLDEIGKCFIKNIKRDEIYKFL
jgi:3-dehydroquinate synthase